MKRDHLLFFAILIAVAFPALPGLGSPENISALLLLLVILSSGLSSVYVAGFAYTMLAISGLIFISTIAGLLLVEGDYSFNPSALGPYVRLVICFQALQRAEDPAKMHRWLLWLGAGASLFALLQFLSPDIVASFTSAHYLARERSSVFTEDFSGNSIVRVIGFFENPSSVALLSISFILLSIRAFSVGQIKGGVLAIFLILHFMAGVFSLSKVFFIGLPLVFLQLILFRYRLAVFLSFLILITSTALILSSSLDQMQVIRYAFESAFTPSVALHNRYLEEVLEVLKRSWFFGYGLVAPQNIIINDSLYLEFGFLVGLFGFLVMTGFLLSWLWRWRRRIMATLYLIGAIVLIAGIGSNSIFGFRVEIFLTAACSFLFVQIHSSGRRSAWTAC